MKEKFQIKKGNPLPLGVTKMDDYYNFSIALPSVVDCRLNVYKIGESKPFIAVPLNSENKVFDIFSIMISIEDINEFEYMYEVKGKEFLDPYAKRITGREIFGQVVEKGTKIVRGAFDFESFHWEEDKPLELPYHEMTLYRLHVRGFTMHNSSKATHKGTYLGVIDKLPYLKELGVNALELMPIVEFNEIISKWKPIGFQNSKYIDYQYSKNNSQNLSSYNNLSFDGKNDSYKINYWGYSEEANYFSPKTSYAYDTKNPIKELKTMIKTLHHNGIEVIMEMNFSKNTNANLIVECLRYWVMEYHIDGFRVNSDAVPINFIATDPILGHTKLLTTTWNDWNSNTYEGVHYKNLAEYNDGFLADVRRFLKGDEEHVGKYMYRIKNNPLKNGVINYITNTNGFTLMDMVSYDIKHNENNHEHNHDGTEYNFSWNCGVEGKTRSKKILKLRLKQIKNALVFLMFSQGTPLILAGDEFGQTQKGNNNAYCQDNEITWLNWNLLDVNVEIYEFLKQLIQIRKCHPILHKEDELRVMDYISCGYPDLSYHGTKAWYPDCTNYSRMLGVMLCGKYAKIDRKKEDDFFYLAINMHWEDHNFDLPQLPNNMKWNLLIDTTDSNIKLSNQRTCKVKARSISVLIGKVLLE